jgi:hypothetical protein
MKDSRVCSAYKVLSEEAESTLDRKLAAVAPAPEKYRANTGWMKERKTIWAPLYSMSVAENHNADMSQTYPVTGSASQRTRMNLNV